MQTTRILAAEHPRLFKTVVLLAVLAFVIQCAMYAQLLIPGVPPDEYHHRDVIRIYADEARFFIHPKDEYAPLHTLGYGPPAYHYLASLIYRPLKALGEDPYPTIRGFGVALAIVYLFAFFGLCRLCLDSWREIALAFVMQSSCFMLILIFAGVSYDVLLIPVSAAVTLFLLRWWKGSRPADLWIALLLSGIGALTKITFLPLLLIFPLALFLGGLRRLDRNMVISGQVGVILSVSVIAVAILCAVFYGRNLLRYQTVMPSCVQVYGHDTCRAVNDIYKRDLRLIAQNEHRPRVGLPAFLKHWLHQTMVGLLGYQGHRSVTPRWYHTSAAGVAVLIALLAWLVGWKGHSDVLKFLFWTGLLYTAVLISFVQYPIHLRLGSLGVAVQGRYLFPVIGPLLIVLAYSLLLGGDARGKNLRFFLITGGLVILDAGMFMAIIHSAILSFS